MAFQGDAKASTKALTVLGLTLHRCCLGIRFGLGDLQAAPAARATAVGSSRCLEAFKEDD